MRDDEGRFAFRPYVSAAERRRKAEREAARLAKQGRIVAPIHVTGRTIATTFWGQAWCKNLESYSDYANRLPRGRSYVRSGSVVDLLIAPGRVTALVAGTRLYTVDLVIRPLDPARWRALITECSGQIGSVVELLSGRLSQAVLGILARREGGLFPAPKEISLDCSCPDWADMCKHVAAVMYGVGARLDRAPELFFTLRDVDQLELVAGAGAERLVDRAPRSKKILASGQLADIFGLDLDDGASRTASAPRPRTAVPGPRSKPVSPGPRGKPAPARPGPRREPAPARKSPRRPRPRP
jgi:uncharacterized Zn finger protein